MDNMYEGRQISKELNKNKKMKSDVKVFQTFKTLLSYILKDKKRMAIALTFSFINSICYIVGSFMIGLIVQLYFSPYLGTQATGNIKDFDTVGFVISLLALALSFILYGVFRYLEQRVYIKLCFEAGARLRGQLMGKLFRSPISFYDKNKTGNLISTLVVDINNVANSLFQMMVQAATSTFNILISIVVMSLASELLTLIVIPVSLIMFALVFLLIKKSQPYFINVQNAFGRLNAFVEEMLVNTKVTNSFDQQAYIYSELEKITRNIRNSAYKGDIIAKSFDTWYGLISNLIILAISAIAAVFYLNKVNVWSSFSFMVNQDGSPTAGLIVLYIMLNWNFMGPFQSILSSTFNAQVGVASTSRIFKLLQVEVPTREYEIIKVDKIQGKIDFNDVYFKYNPNALEYQLKAATFSVQPGQTVAIVGPTGAGKTTIISLLSKYYDYQRGSIKIDGNELKSLDVVSLRDNMTIVLQDSFLFNETILDNLRMTNPNATMEQIQEAAKLTHAHHFIMNMSNGYDTMIENNGANLSQGQKQLISLTRAILSNKNLLILDEATSNIDSSTEQIVQKAMLKLMENKTTFVIAHRLSTIKNADMIIVVDNGLIIEKGTHQSLLEKKGFYYNLYTSQFDK
ncbi:ABC transporter ATP-binding protein [Mycoplasmopsis verecunda]|uniref:ATP-binding cassette, subfamily B n=1 Tax=Mycoplasmopsis verecunda TaxID=171291 RepID=A0A1T4L8W5_9BACT|nr:ABC transporter ATP-binding protein [Mycoplasmopsis verecunda]WPB54484.1 ABC transporter ATP-binding protein [Mycoplasmopsis verecunda]SJZ51195.1 ATP-binding cassette, subfamily B [Mycoplasmopsis verecunda]